MSNINKKFTLEGKTAFIIGGFGLIGSEVALAYLSAGANIIILDRINNLKNFNKLKVDNVKFVKFNCSKINKLDESLKNIVEQVGVPDILINCAYPRSKDWGNSSFKNISLENLKTNIEIQLIGSSWISRLIAQSMLEKRISGSIIHLSSIYGKVGQDLNVYKGTGLTENMSYSIIKGGLINLTRQMSSYYGQFNIRVNTICPGGLKGHVAGESNTQDPKFVRQYNEKVPLKRMGDASEVASTALFLASDASSYITGATIMVDGGWTAV